MNLSIPKDSISLRKKDLQRKIFDALNLGDQKVFTILQSQWVHRYGLESLPEEKQLESLFIEGKELLKSPYNKKANQEESLDSEMLNEKIDSIRIEDELKTENELPDESLHSNVSKNQNNLESDLNEEIITKEDESKYIKEEINSTEFNLEDNNVQEKEIKLDSNDDPLEDVTFPAPPPPTLNNLRRWISTE